MLVDLREQADIMCGIKVRLWTVRAEQRRETERKRKKRRPGHVKTQGPSGKVGEKAKMTYAEQRKST